MCRFEIDLTPETFIGPVKENDGILRNGIGKKIELKDLEDAEANHIKIY